MWSGSGVIELSGIIRALPENLKLRPPEGVPQPLRLVLFDTVSLAALRRCVVELGANVSDMQLLADLANANEEVVRKALIKCKEQPIFVGSVRAIKMLRDMTLDHAVRVSSGEPSDYMHIFAGEEGEEAFVQGYGAVGSEADPAGDCDTANQPLQRYRNCGRKSRFHLYKARFETAWAHAHLSLADAQQRLDDFVELMLPIAIANRAWLLHELSLARERLPKAAE
jgi:hypothetical protein